MGIQEQPQLPVHPLLDAELEPAAAEGASTWSGLPPNVLVHIFLNLSLQDLCCCSSTCSHWHASSHADTIWANLLRQHYGNSTPRKHANSCRECMQMLRSASIWSCGTSWPALNPSGLRGSQGSSRATELVQLWSNTAPLGATPLPLDCYCHLPQGFAATAAAAGRAHFVLLNYTGDVMDSRVPPAPGPASSSAAAAGPGAAAAAAAAGGALQEVAGEGPGLYEAGANAGQEGAMDPEQQQQQQGMLLMRNLWSPPGAPITCIAAGAGHVLALTGCGQVWAWGSNASGQLGLGHNRNWQPYPAEVTAALEGAWKTAGDPIMAAACGDDHSALLAGSGVVYTAGCNKQGQCGQGEQLQLCGSNGWQEAHCPMESSKTRVLPSGSCAAAKHWA